MKLFMSLFASLLSLTYVYAENEISDGKSRVRLDNESPEWSSIQISGKSAELLWNSMKDVKESIRPGTLKMRVGDRDINTDIPVKEGRDYTCALAIVLEQNMDVTLNINGEPLRSYQCTFRLEKPASGQLGQPK